MVGRTLATVGATLILKVVLASPYDHTIAVASESYDIPHGLLARLIRVESSFRPEVVSNKGAVGIAQIIPKHHPEVDPTDPQASIRYAASYLRRLHDRFGRWSHAVAAYNWGPTRVAEWRDGERRMPATVETYVEKITEAPCCNAP